MSLSIPLVSNALSKVFSLSSASTVNQLAEKSTAPFMCPPLSTLSSFHPLKASFIRVSTTTQESSVNLSCNSFVAIVFISISATSLFSFSLLHPPSRVTVKTNADSNEAFFLNVFII